MIKTAVFGYGNIGRAVLDTLSANEDMELCGIVSKSAAGKKVCGLTIVSDLSQLSDKIDVAILALDTRSVPNMAQALLEKGICTVDSFDIHSQISTLRSRLDEVAKKNNAASIIAAGWDPGSDSVIRALFLAMAPAGLTYTDFGPGVSMGHTVAVKAIEGVKNALSVTIPLGTSIHRRMVYIELEDGFELENVAKVIKSDDYFAHDETHVVAVQDINELRDLGHGVHIERKGVSGITQNQLFEFNMKINNPALTAQMMVSSARAVVKQTPGCYTLIEIPPVDFLAISKERAVELLV